MLIALAIDPSLGRFDVSSAPDQALMEMLVQDLGSFLKRALLNSHGEFQDVCQWKTYNGGCTCTDDRVTTVKFQYVRFTGEQFPFECIPPLVQVFDMATTRLRGTLDASVLPGNLAEIYVNSNFLHGSLCWKSFPRTMQQICLNNNAFTEGITLADLPDTLTVFQASRNKLNGELSLKNLPKALRRLEVDHNALSGSIIIDTLPEWIAFIDLSNNAFSGDLRLMDFGPSLRIVNVWGHLSGTAVLREAHGPMEFKLHYRGLTAVVDETGNKHEWEARLVAENKRRQQTIGHLLGSSSDDYSSSGDLDDSDTSSYGEFDDSDEY